MKVKIKWGNVGGWIEIKDEAGEKASKSDDYGFPLWKFVELAGLTRPREGENHLFGPKGPGELRYSTGADYLEFEGEVPEWFWEVMALPIRLIGHEPQGNPWIILEAAEALVSKKIGFGEFKRIKRENS